MADNNEWRVPSVFTEICELRKECHDLHNENADLHKRNECQAQQLSSLRDDLSQALRDRDESQKLAGFRARRITELKGTGNEDSHLAPAQQFMQVKLLEDVPKGVNALHAVGQIIGLLHVSRKDTRNIGHWLINSVREELE